MKAADDTMPRAIRMAAEIATVAATTMPTPTRNSTMQRQTSANAGEPKSSLGSIGGSSVAPRATVTNRKSNRIAGFTVSARNRLTSYSPANEEAVVGIWSWHIGFSVCGCREERSDPSLSRETSVRVSVGILVRLLAYAPDMPTRRYANLPAPQTRPKPMELETKKPHPAAGGALVFLMVGFG